MTAAVACAPTPLCLVLAGVGVLVELDFDVVLLNVSLVFALAPELVTMLPVPIVAFEAVGLVTIPVLALSSFDVPLPVKDPKPSLWITLLISDGKAVLVSSSKLPSEATAE